MKTVFFEEPTSQEKALINLGNLDGYRPVFIFAHFDGLRNHMAIEEILSKFQRAEFELQSFGGHFYEDSVQIINIFRRYNRKVKHPDKRAGFILLVPEGCPPILERWRNYSIER